MPGSIIRPTILMFLDKKRHALLRTLIEIESRLRYFACSVLSGDDPESVALLRSAADNVEHVVNRLEFGESLSGSTCPRTGGDVFLKRPKSE